jgi:GT2 family glycosyltransferase
MTKTTVVICSANRPEILEETVADLFLQSVGQVNILISAPDLESVPLSLRSNPQVEVIVSVTRGLCFQRNAAVAKVSTPYMAFIDDDVELVPNFIEAMEGLFDSDSSVVLSTAHVIADGVTSQTGIDRGRARQMLSSFKPTPAVDYHEAYGCNMFVRTEIAKKTRFDEALPLYGWLEDLDFSIRCQKLGRLVLNNQTGLVHMGTTRGRTSDVRLGYSQIANPYYIWKKTSKPGIGWLIFTQWIRYTGVNLTYFLLFWIKRRGDRVGRLRGNAKALLDLVLGKMHPRRILAL